ncbi:MAG: efflux transporter outer membrane subunit [Verrucomicrobiota bacterium]|jgi:multidrug efflux system outer membrane protein
MNKNVFLPLLGIAIVAAGCTMAPKYTRPKAPIPAEWPNGAAYQVGQRSPSAPAATNAPAVSQLRWQEFFSDGKLRQVIGMALTNNRDLRIAALNVERSRAMYGIQRAELFPTINATGSAIKQRIPANVEGFPEPMTIENYGVNLGVASWEIDFFGRIRSLKNEALAEYLATEQARRSAQILLISSVADAYLTLAADQENLELAETTLAAQRSTYDLIKRRYDLGLVPELNLHQAEMQVDAALGDAARYTQLVAQDKNALNLLLGVPAPDELLPAGLSGVIPPKEISSGLSSEVLLRRPDVLQAEDLLKAANADIGAARAAFFPQISLTAAIGTSSSELSGLFKAGSGAWSYAPQIVMPIFDARTWSAHKAAKVQREIAVAQYEKAIQSAFREVADALATRGTVDQQVAAQQSLVNAATETHRLSVSRYDKGIDSYLTVLDAQRSMYAAQQGLVSLRLAKLANQVQLYAVLGGGWREYPPQH